MSVYVVMGNDYPAAVFATEEAAEAYCVAKRKEPRTSGIMIYWRVYEFALQGATP